ncbi:MAG: hypothetical protein ACKV2O_13650 [Acidimicrobiales bacterium]
MVEPPLVEQRRQSSLDVAGRFGEAMPAEATIDVIDTRRQMNRPRQVTFETVTVRSETLD